VPGSSELLLTADHTGSVVLRRHTTHAHADRKTGHSEQRKKLGSESERERVEERGSESESGVCELSRIQASVVPVLSVCFHPDRVDLFACTSLDLCYRVGVIV
jgi:hypothetical protein